MSERKENPWILLPLLLCLGGLLLLGCFWQGRYERRLTSRYPVFIRQYGITIRKWRQIFFFL